MSSLLWIGTGVGLLNKVPIPKSIKMDYSKISPILIIFFLTAFVEISDCQRNQTCFRQDFLTPVQNFQLDRILGTWIPFKSYAASSEDAQAPSYTCPETLISYEPSWFPYNIKDSYISGAGNLIERGYSVFYEEDQPAVWTKFIFEFPSTNVTQSVYLQTDYDNWALQYSCSEPADNFDDHHETLIIWTRTRSPDPETVSFLQILVQNYGFSLDNEIPMDHSICE